MEHFQLLHQLPQELRQEVCGHLDKRDLGRLSLASRWTYSLAAPLIWREVTLTDCSTRREGREGREIDHHDDTPLLKKLLVLATRPEIAGHVQVVTHMCHLPPAAIFNELLCTPLSGQTLSLDPRTTELVKLAVKGMQRVHTLRIISGHPNLNDALLRCFFNTDRVRQTPIRRLWMEGCRIAAGCDLSIADHPLGLPRGLGFAGLESLRLRRMPLRSAMAFDEPPPPYRLVHARGSWETHMQDGHGGMYTTTINDAWSEMRRAPEPDQRPFTGTMPVLALTGQRLLEIFLLPIKWDDWVYEHLVRELRLPSELREFGELDYESRARLAFRGPLLDPLHADWKALPESKRQQQRERHPSATAAINMLQNTSSTLTSLCFDWVLTRPYGGDVSQVVSWLNIYADLLSLHFPNLRAFQYRNSIIADTAMPSGLFLLDHFDRGKLAAQTGIDVSLLSVPMERLDLAGLQFMEAHPRLQCLAWPMDAFFSRKQSGSDVASRVRAIIDNLGRTLIDLRVDAMYSASGERQSESSLCEHLSRRERRRRFITNFAPRMTKVRSIKIEGGLPRDERREILRALHRCPIEKIVLIGVCSPLGNTWGEAGADLMTSEIFDLDDASTLEPEHKDAIHRIGYTTPAKISSDFEFAPVYDWPPGPPMMHTIASYHANTVTELKFCGYKGAPVLFEPTPITSPLLAALKHFHRLQTLIISVCLVPVFEGDRRDHEIIQYWMDSRTPTTTSLVRVSVADDDMGGWERELSKKYAPKALAAQVTRQIGPCLSEQAKAREAGVHVRTSMCLGDFGGIFDLDVAIAKDASARDVCLSFSGPREELERERRKSKLDNRRWF